MLRMQLTPNKRMHATRDTHHFIYFQRLRRAGDAGRYAAESFLCESEAQDVG
jgi:hypothetical protein